MLNGKMKPEDTNTGFGGGAAPDSGAFGALPETFAG